MPDNLRARVAVALLVDEDLCNRTWKTTLHWHQYGFGYRVLRLPPHVSLKQPFFVPSIQHCEAFFEQFAEQTEAQTVSLDGFALYETGEESVVVIRVVEDARLRALHNELNQALTDEFGPTPAAFDGEEYRFHLTVAIGRYRVEQQAQLRADIDTIPFQVRTVARKLGIFIYEESREPNAHYGTREYGTFRTLSLRK